MRRIRREKLDRLVLPDSVERSTLIKFVAALHARSESQLRHLQSEMSRILRFAENIKEQAARASAEQRKAMAMLAPPKSTPSKSLDELSGLVAEPQRKLMEHVAAETVLMSAMNLGFFGAPAGHEFITSDVPVTWFDPDLYKRAPFYQVLGLGYRNVEVTLPVSPKLILHISHHPQLSGRWMLASEPMVEEFNRRTRWECYRDFVTIHNRKNPYWFIDLKPPPA